MILPFFLFPMLPYLLPKAPFSMFSSLLIIKACKNNYICSALVKYAHTNISTNASISPHHSHPACCFYIPSYKDPPNDKAVLPRESMWITHKIIN